jgi:hypothetical protein
MEIKLNTSLDSVARVQTTSSNASRAIESKSVPPAFEHSKALEAQLQQVPDVRLDQLEKALNLIGNPAYPPSETINGLAALLATHFPHIGDELAS